MTSLTFGPALEEPVGVGLGPEFPVDIWTIWPMVPTPAPTPAPATAPAAAGITAAPVVVATSVPPACATILNPCDAPAPDAAAAPMPAVAKVITPLPPHELAHIMRRLILGNDQIPRPVGRGALIHDPVARDGVDSLDDQIARANRGVL